VTCAVGVIRLGGSEKGLTGEGRLRVEDSSCYASFFIALNIKDPETDRLVRALAAETGESITTAVAIAVRERLERVQGSRHGPDLIDDIRLIAERCAALPVLDSRPAEEIPGYDEHGLPN
jgi:antitoxin VapB